MPAVYSFMGHSKHQPDGFFRGPFNLWGCGAPVCHPPVSKQYDPHTHTHIHVMLVLELLLSLSKGEVRGGRTAGTLCLNNPEDIRSLCIPCV